MDNLRAACSIIWVFMQVQPKAPLLQILRVAGAQEEIFTLKEVGTACWQSDIVSNPLMLLLILWPCYVSVVEVT